MTDFLRGDREFVEKHATDIEYQTDKPEVKIVPCVGCGRNLGVNVFYAPKIARCAECGSQSKTAGKGQAAIVQAGRTDPAKAKNLADALINKSFAHATCPMDAEHAMELKSVTHNPNYGPSRVVGYEKGAAMYKNDVGETVMHQCNDCKTTVSYSTTVQALLRRQNEPKPNAGTAPAALWLLGERAHA